VLQGWVECGCALLGTGASAMDSAHVYSGTKDGFGYRSLEIWIFSINMLRESSKQPLIGKIYEDSVLFADFLQIKVNLYSTKQGNPPIVSFHWAEYRLYIFECRKPRYESLPPYRFSKFFHLSTHYTS